MSDANLIKHGTQAFQLSPSSIIATAAADIARRQINRHEHANGRGSLHRYAFHREHVRQATSPRDLIRRAATDPLRGQVSKKRSTLLLYTDTHALAAALEAAGPEATE